MPGRVSCIHLPAALLSILYVSISNLSNSQKPPLTTIRNGI
nr:MAG TPA: hypothetical protein [Caudoviricetes sp.]DAX18880.1 MAG TPA: hypothetical protein [Caudoviricetes sp.]